MMDKKTMENVVSEVIMKTVMIPLKLVEKTILKAIELQDARITKLEKRVQEIENKVGIVRLKMN